MASYSNTRPMFLPQGEISLSKASRLALMLALGVTALSISARLNVPMWPVPFTMQTFAVLVIGATYGRAMGLATVMSYLTLGALGLPLFSMGGGLGYLTMPTGGYLVGFIPAVWLAGLMGETGRDRRLVTALLGFGLAHFSVFIFGVGWLQYHVGFERALEAGFYTFLPGATTKFCAASLVMILGWKLKEK